MQIAEISSARPAAQSPAILAVRGGSARLEGKFDIEESIEVQCELKGELNVGGTMIIGERGAVAADVKTVNAIILGTYSGNLVASGSIEIAASGRVSGTLESNELVIAKGGIFTGTVARAPQPEPAAASETVKASGSTAAAGDSAQAAEPAAAAASESAQESPVAASESAQAAEPVASAATAQFVDTDEDADLSRPAAAAAARDEEAVDITAIGSLTDFDEISDVAVPVIPTLADRPADEAKGRSKQGARLQQITLS